jgi:hypothetical protein
MIAGQIIRPHRHFRLVAKVRLAHQHTNLGATNATRKTRYTVFILAIRGLVYSIVG